MSKLSVNPAIKQLAVPVAHGGIPEGARAELLTLYPNARMNSLPRALTEDEMIEFLEGCDAAIVGLDLISARVLEARPELRIIGKFGAGYDTVDLVAVDRHGVMFGYEWGVNALPVAELTLSMMIASLRLVPAQNLAMREAQRPRFRMGRLLSGRTVGIHGCGHVGRELVRLLKPFGCEVLACDVRDRSAFYAEYGVTAVDFDELLARSEALTLHLPRTKSTIGLYDREVLGRMRPDAVLINTCRGGVVDEDALLERLESGALAGACFDVFAIEPATNDRLIRHPNMLATPHMGAAVETIRVDMFRSAINSLVRNGPIKLADYDY